MRMRLMFCIALSAATCGTSYGQQLAASDVKKEDVRNSRIPEVIVTARRREEILHDVPLSIVVKTGEDLTSAQVDSVDELSRLVPGFRVEANLNQPQANYFLRGIGTRGSTGVESSVGVVVDGAVMPYVTVFGEDFNDVARVEVLRGPQGTLFGKNSSAGLLNYATKDPTERFSATAGLSYGSYNEAKFGGAVSGPIAGESLLGRISYYSTHRDGYLNDVSSGQKLGDDSTQSFRGTLLYRPTDITRVRLSAYNVWRGRGMNNGPQFPIVSFGPLSAPAQIEQNRDLAGPENTSVRLASQGISGVPSPIHYWGSTLQWDQEIGDHTLTSITSYLNYLWEVNVNFTQTVFPSPPESIINSVQTDKLWTQELRLSSPADGWVDYQAGLYFYRENHSNDALAVDTQVPYFGNSFAPTKTLNYAAFGEANFHVSDRVTLIGGARWTHEKKDIVLTSLAGPAGYFQLFPVNDTADSVTVQNWSWRTGLQWKPTERDMLYATASRGFKGPGFNAVNAIVGTSQQVAPEIATTYEIGAKTILLDGRLAADLALYHTTFKDLQSQGVGFATRPDGSLIIGPTGDPITISALVNAGNLRSRGVEFELRATPFAGFNLSLAGAYIDAIYRDFPNAPCYIGQLQFGTGCTLALGATGLGIQDLSNNRLRAPKYSGNFGGGQEWSFAGLPFNGFVRADYQWRSETYPDTSRDPFSGLPSVGLLNMSAGLRGKDGHYTISVYAKNLTNRFYELEKRGGFGTVIHVVPLDYQRIFGVNVTYRIEE